MRALLSFKTITLLLFLLLLGLSLALRVPYWDDAPLNKDLSKFITYFETLRNEGLLYVMQTYFTKLSIAYFLLWAPLAWADLPANISIKALASLFDYVCAYWLFRLVRLRYPSPSPLPYMAALCAVLTPMFITSVSLWGQQDSIYTALALGGVYFLARGQMKQARRHDALWSSVYLALALSFKLQTALLIAVVAFFFGRGFYRMRHLLVMPSVYLALQAARWLAGLAPEHLLNDYYQQVIINHGISVGANNLHALIPFWFPELALNQFRLGMGLAVLLCALALVAGWRSRKLPMLAPQVVMLCVLLNWAAVYVLPRMHERYFIVAHMLAIAAAWMLPRAAGWAAVLLTVIAMYTYPREMMLMGATDSKGYTLAMMIGIVAFIAIYCLRYGNPFASRAKPPRFYILCGNAAHNKGDRGNLASQLNLLRESFPGADITLDSYEARRDRGWYDARIVKRSRYFLSLPQFWYLWRADTVIWGGGALIADNSGRLLVPYWLAIILTVRLLLGKPVMAWAQGIVLETKLGTLLGALALNLATIVTVRDRGSYALLAKLRLLPPLRRTADPAILLTPSSKETGEALLAANGIVRREGKAIFAIAPTFWHFYHQPQDWAPYPLNTKYFERDEPRQGGLASYKHGLAALADRLAEMYDATIVLLPRYASSDWKDVQYLHEIRALMTRQDHVHVFTDDSHRPEDYYSMWHCFDFIIGMALHDVIFATSTNRPCVHLFYEDKGRDFFEALGAEARLLHWQSLTNPQGRERIMAAIIFTLTHWPHLCQSMQPPRNRLMRYARRNARYLRWMRQRARA